MAASIGRPAFILQKMNLNIKKRSCMLFYPPGQLTYCRKMFYSRFIKENSADTDKQDHKITKESKVEQSVSDYLEESCVGTSGHIKYRNHPGAMRKISTKVPVRLVRSVKVLLEKHPVEALTTKTQKLTQYLLKRQPPMSVKDVRIKAKEVEQNIIKKDGIALSELEGEEYDLAAKELEAKVLARLRSLVYNWQPMKYDAFTSYIYMMGRVASDYAVHIQCFTEMKKRDPDFKPTSVYHFGSRVGSGIWAADKIWKDIYEHYCVDSSGFMNTIARLLLQDGNAQNPTMSIKGVHFRQFAPSSKQNKFSLVVSPYMLMEQTSDKERLQLVLDMWELTENYLVLIENGTTAGFNLIDEAREFLLQVSSNNPNSNFEGHVFSPCPHDIECPKKRDKKQPCLTECASTEVDFTSEKTTSTKVRYSFVILKKGPRASETAWPRILQLSKARRHNHCHVCLPCGQLQHVVISKGRFEKHLYGCSKYGDQGDFLPVQLSKWAPKQEVDDNENNENEDDDVINCEDDSSQGLGVIGDDVKYNN